VPRDWIGIYGSPIVQARRIQLVLSESICTTQFHPASLPPCLDRVLPDFYVLASSFSISKSADIIAPHCHQFHLLLEIEVNSIIVSCNCRPQSPNEASDRRGLGGVGRRKSILRFYPELPHSAPHRRTTNCVDIYSPWRRQAEE